MSIERSLRELIAHVPQVGRVTWIGTRAARGEPMRVVGDVELLAGRGLRGDRAAKRGGGKRQVTLVMAEHLEVIGRLLAREAIDPTILRRNLVVRGFNLNAVKLARFRVGDALLEGTGECAPCSKMEVALGDGGYAAMRGHGGITARVLEGAVVRIGDAIVIDSGRSSSLAG